MTHQRFSESVLDEIKQSSERIKTESLSRTPEEPLSFGIQYLDECLGGIFKNDFIVLGARSGIGKTEAAKICALANAHNKNIFFFALEAEPNEIERRIKYSIVSNAVYGSLRNLFSGVRFNFMDWMIGKYKPILGDYEAEIDKIVEETVPGLHTYYQKNSTLNEENIEKTILSIQDKADLIIIDHLHFFDFEDENENRAMKKLVKKLKSISQNTSVPILMLAHLRKSDKRFQSLVPDMDDFHGSSDITKIATKVVLLAAANGIELGDKSVFPTYILAAKNRYDSSRARYVSVCGFNMKENNYAKKYEVGRISFDGKEFNPEEEAPYWAVSAINAKRVSPVQNTSKPGVLRSSYGSNS